MSAIVANPVQPQTGGTTTVVERKRRRSRAAVTLLATANAILRVLGVNNSKSTANAVLKLHQVRIFDIINFILLIHTSFYET